MNQTPTKIPSGVGLLDKALQVLDQFTVRTPAWTQAELGRATGLPKSTLSRLVRYFRARGYLHYLDSQGRYVLGAAAIDLGRRASVSFDIGAAAKPILEKLGDEIKETVILGSYIPDTSEVVCIAQIPGAIEGLRVFQNVGSSFPLHAGAIAKAVLAYLPEDVKTAVLAAPLDAITDHTICDPVLLARDLEDIKARGYALSREETFPGVFGIGAPFFGSGSAVAGSVAIGAPNFRMKAGTVLDYARRVTAAAAAITRLLGGSDVPMSAEARAD